MEIVCKGKTGAARPQAQGKEVWHHVVFLSFGTADIVLNDLRFLEGCLNGGMLIRLRRAPRTLATPPEARSCATKPEADNREGIGY